MNDAELQTWVEQISLDSFGVAFRHRATFNYRLRTTGGRYFMKSHDIEINPGQLENFGRDEVERIIKHELCHYHLHLAKSGYRHRDPEFKALLAKVGGSRYCQSLQGGSTRRTLPYRYKLICEACGMVYSRKRKVDTLKYRCGSCRGNLKQYKLEESV